MIVPENCGLIGETRRECAVTAESTRASVTELYSAYARRDFERVAGLIDEDVDWIIHGPVQIFPFAGHRRGRNAVLEALGGIAKDYVLERYEPRIVIVEGDRAAVVSDVAFQQRSTGRTVSMQLANFLRFRDGKLVEFREFANTFDLVEQALGRWIDLH
jgi:ketosteroid isomerase-like protein